MSFFYSNESDMSCEFNTEMIHSPGVRSCKIMLVKLNIKYEWLKNWDMLCIMSAYI